MSVVFMSLQVVPCSFVSCRFMLRWCCVVSCFVAWCRDMSTCFVLPGGVLYCVLLFRVVLFCFVSCHVVSCSFVFCCVVSFPVVLYHVVLSRTSCFVSCHIVSCCFVLRRVGWSADNNVHTSGSGCRVFFMNFYEAFFVIE